MKSSWIKFQCYKPPWKDFILIVYARPYKGLATFLLLISIVGTFLKVKLWRKKTRENVNKKKEILRKEEQNYSDIIRRDTPSSCY